ncbi:hypothetical protein [Deferribacter abyssi]|uniref:hypothetical protein n=1 Tax=Deferribacter abyssi TaxID=213806 RepID=UPI003C206F8E
MQETYKKLEIYHRLMAWLRERFIYPEGAIYDEFRHRMQKLGELLADYDVSIERFVQEARKICAFANKHFSRIKIGGYYAGDSATNCRK